MLRCPFSPLGVNKYNTLVSLNVPLRQNELKSHGKKVGKRAPSSGGISVRLLIYGDASVLLHEAKGTLGGGAAPPLVAAALEENKHITPDETTKSRAEAVNTFLLLLERQPAAAPLHLHLLLLLLQQSCWKTL